MYEIEPNPIFGVGWIGTPVADESTFVDIPVGQHCVECDTPILEGESGSILPCMRMTFENFGEPPQHEVSHRPVHRECLLLTVFGHQYGVCRCTDFAGTDDRRRGALLLLQRMEMRQN